MDSYEMKPPAPLRRIAGIPVALVAVLTPWIAFLVPFILMSSKLYFSDPDAAKAASWGTFGALLLCVIIGGLRARTLRYHTGWFWFLAPVLVLNFTAGIILGDFNFYTNMLPYYDVTSLNSYKNVDVSLDSVNGNILMDAGRIEYFVEGTNVDLTRSNAFVATRTYCVAPIIQGDAMEQFDFWAVGIDCCEKDSSAWSCPETSIETARGALRVMNDEMRPYFHLSVEQATTVHNLTVSNPLFFYWVEDPRAELSAWKTDGMYVCSLSIILSFLVALILPAIYAQFNVSWFRW